MNTFPDVGSLVRLKVQCLGNAAGTVGVCYERYQLDDRAGFSFIFENGRYDGFSPEEVEQFLEEIGYYLPIGNYRFINVMKLSEDFRDGVFDGAFAEALMR